ncbi:MAG: LysR family transcriptional regulator [Candidatus Eisenbacteria bacterium]|uniref:LysR family transcriptional regulator n=1 Tax=Eiseniibacteriota bacterium TaxID=2212470 RepID=A0A7Y2E9D0_UNCEI|nr:LysR family transcriptional regulator [Candidatus Eisenbacteria bacterium]
MNVHHLELFYYVARHGGISRALPYMPYGIQQPAVSSQIIQLEKDLEVKLFERRPFALTHSGERLYRFSQPFFSQLPAMKRALAQEVEFLRIGAGELVIRNYLPQSLGKFRQKMPKVRVSLASNATVPLLAQVQSDELDVAIVPVSPRTPAGLTQASLVDIGLALIVPKKHPARTAAALLKSHSDESLISVPPGEPLSDLFQIELARRGQHWLPEIELADLSSLESYVESGMGVGVSVNLPPRSKGLRALSLLRFPKLRVAAYYKKQASPALKLLLKILQQDAKRFG